MRLPRLTKENLIGVWLALLLALVGGCLESVHLPPPDADLASPEDEGLDLGEGDRSTLVDSGDDAPPTDAAQTVGPATYAPEQRIDWSHAGVVKPDGTQGIPDASTGTRCATLSPSNTVAEINAAIASCSNKGSLLSKNQEVYLQAGTYTLASSIVFDTTRNVTLRGAGRGTGPGATILHFTAGSIGISAGANLIYQPVDTTRVRNWVAGYAQGTTVITLDSITGITAGNVLLLDQLNDDAVPGMNVPLSSVDVTSNYTVNGGTGASRAGGTRAQMQYVKVTAIDPTKNQVTISPGLYMPSWRSSQVPQAYFWSNTWAEMNGVEDLTIENAGSAVSNLAFSNCYNCWARNIQSTNSTNSHLQTFETARIEVRDSYFYGTQTGGGDSRGVIMLLSSDQLVISNIFEHVTMAISLMGTEGSVVAYNFMTGMDFTVYPNIMMHGLATESGYNSMNLFEGNYSNQVAMDNNHGAGSRNTVFRNRLTGWETGRIHTTLPVIVGYMNHYENIIGNLLGKTGIQDTYETSSSNNLHPDTSVYGLGYWQGSWSPTAKPYDPRVVSTLLRHGNYDYVSNATVWDPSIANHTLPASLYLSTKPAWWGANPWPAFDPGSPAASDNYLNLPAGNAWHAMFPSKIPSEVGP
jgi:hypothetical protein